MSDKLYEMAQNAQQRFFYGQLSVALGALALSIQFSPKMGKELWWALIGSWVLLFISSFIGGWRMSMESIFLRNNYIAETSPGRAADAKSLMAKHQGMIVCLSRVQMWSLIIGLLLSMAFAIANYYQCVISTSHCFA